MNESTCHGKVRNIILPHGFLFGTWKVWKVLFLVKIEKYQMNSEVIKSFRLGNSNFAPHFFVWHLKITLLVKIEKQKINSEVD